jgi:hypothetical protein
MYLWRRVALLRFKYAILAVRFEKAKIPPPFLNGKKKDTPVVPSTVSYSKVWLSMGLLNSGRPTTRVVCVA